MKLIKLEINADVTILEFAIERLENYDTVPLKQLGLQVVDAYKAQMPSAIDKCVEEIMNKGFNSFGNALEYKKILEKHFPKETNN